MRSTLAKIAKRWIFPYGSTAPILYGACRGMKFLVTPEGGHSMILGYERGHQRFIAPKIKPGMTVLDIGANVGQYALLFGRLVGASGRVVSFEPYPPAFRRLEENVKLNGLSRVTCVNLALADKTGRLSFSVHPGSTAMGKLSAVEPTFEHAEFQKLEVEAARLDDVAERMGLAPDVLKIDTEGAAAAVLSGAEKTLEKHRPAVYIELHGPEEQNAVLGLMKRGWKFQDLEGRPVTDISKWATPLWGTRS